MKKTLKNPGQVPVSGDGSGGLCNDTIERTWLGAFNMEEWKDVQGYEGIYQVSSYGRVRRLSQETWRVTPRSPKYNYVKGTTSSGTRNGKYRLIYLSGGKRISLHRLVAIHFIPNPKNKPQVNHKDGDPQNNRTDNLEWCTSSENMKHCYDVLGYRQSEETKHKRAAKHFKKVIDLNDCKIYESVKQYSEIKGIAYSMVISRLNGHVKNNLNIKYL